MQLWSRLLVLVSCCAISCSSQNQDSAIGVAEFHTCFSFSGEVRCWGQGQHGRLGTGSTSLVGAAADQMSVIVPIPFSLMLGKVTYVSIGNIHSCALFDSGRIACFGDGSSGRLGLGNSAQVGCGGSCLSTVQLIGIEFGDPTVLATAVSSGSHHSCALFTNGKVRWYVKQKKSQTDVNMAFHEYLAFSRNKNEY